MKAVLTVRPAGVQDAGGIAEVHVQSWREAYPHLVPASVLASLSAPQRSLRWAELIVADSPDVWVVVDAEQIVGWASVSAGRDVDGPGGPELEGIYVLASHYGTGAGQFLLDAAIGTAPAYLWVAADNPRAQAFYARNGFVPDGATKTAPLAGIPVDVVRLVR